MPKGFIIPIVPAIVIVLILTVGGVVYLNKSNISQVLPPTPSAIITPSSSPTPDETANWGMSSVGEYGFKLPAFNWKMTSEGGVVSIEEGWRQSTGSTGGEHISIRRITSGLDPQKYIINSLSPNSKPQNLGQVSINGFLGEKWSYNVENTDNNFAIFFDHNNKKYVLSKEGNSIPAFADINKELDQILSTFKFLK